MQYWPPNELVFPFGGSYVCANFGENRSRNATVRVLADGQTVRQTDRQTDANRFYNLSYAIAMGQIILKQPRLLTFCKIYAYKVYFMCLLIREYDVIDVANWKLGQDKTKLNSHRISRLDKTEKSWTCSVSKFSVADNLDLLWVHFTPQTRTRQDKTVLSCPCLRCEIGNTRHDMHWITDC